MVNSLWDYKMCPPLVFAGQFTVFGFDMINISWKWQPNATDLASIRNVPQFRHQQNFSHLFFFVRVISFWIISYVFFFLSFLFWSTNIFFFTAASHFHRFALCFIAFEPLLRLIVVKKKCIAVICLLTGLSISLIQNTIKPNTKHIICFYRMCCCRTF